MRVWLACFFVLFALAELFDWVKEFHLPLPIYILGGAFLAVASNYDKLFGYYLSDPIAREATAILENPQLDSSPPPSYTVPQTHSSGLKDSQKSQVER